LRGGLTIRQLYFDLPQPAAGAMARDATLRANGSTDEDALTRAVIALASEYGRYGYRRITTLLGEAGWQVGKDRVQCIWRREGLKVPQKQRPRGRLWLNDGSCVRLRRHDLHLGHLLSHSIVHSMSHLLHKAPLQMQSRLGAS
jgi:transposase InsO family protein